VWSRERYCRDDWLWVGRVMLILGHNYVILTAMVKVAMRTKAAVN